MYSHSEGMGTTADHHTALSQAQLQRLHLTIERIRAIRSNQDATLQRGPGLLEVAPKGLGDHNQMPERR